MSTENIVKFLQTAYSDEKLAALLAHTLDGKLSHMSCSCLAGIPTATHPLGGYEDFCRDSAHNPGGSVISHAFNRLGRERDDGTCVTDTREADALRRYRLLPLIYAEIARRDREKERLASTPGEYVKVFITA